MEVENLDPIQHQKWLDKHGFKPDENGCFPVHQFEGNLPVAVEDLFSNIRHNATTFDFACLDQNPYDERTFVMVCGGPSLADYLGEIRQKALQPERYFVACSNMTAKYLLENGITPHAHFIIDPQKRKMLDLSETSDKIAYWINIACHPAVFETLQKKGIKPYVFLADWDKEGKAIEAVKESAPKDKQSMMVIQGGTMAGLRAINIADGLGFRSMEYYGFDATVRVGNGISQAYAYNKKRPETVIEVTCPACDAKFDTTLVFQKQVLEFLSWRRDMPWMDITIIGGGLIDHAKKHAEALEASKPKITYRYTQAYKQMQKELHAGSKYGVSGKEYAQNFFMLLSQVAKRLGSCSVLDYGAAQGGTMKAVRDAFLLHPAITDRCYDPFVEGIDSAPQPADVVICTDVMEHVEPECTDAVLDHIASLTKRVAFFSIALTPAIKTLSDGRNAHINLRPAQDWQRDLTKRFLVSQVQYRPDVFIVVCSSIQDAREFAQRKKAA
jgi:hypothetical protein